MTDYKSLAQRTINDLAERKRQKGDNIKHYISKRQTQLMRQQRTKRGYRYVIGQV